ncbi:MAG: hypothetical protein JSS91_04450 [Bacteroidetes bacterium]|nr:hypothetical protein [Bacteroidota bacterium]
MDIINYKLLSFLNLLSKEDLSQFKKFVSSPVYSSGRNYLPLLEEIIKYRNEATEKISAFDLYEKVYPGKKFSGQTLKNRFSELLKLGEEFIIYKNVKGDEIQRDYILLDAYLKNKMFRFYEGKYKKALKFLDSHKTDDKKFSNIYSLNQKNLKYLNETDKIDKYYLNLYDHTIYSTCMSLIALFDYGIEFKQQDYLGRKYEFNIVLNVLKKLDLKEILGDFERKDLEIINVVKLYYHLYKAYENLDKESFYFEARKIFSEIKRNFSDDYKLKFYMIFIYYCTRKQNLGDKKFYPELFKLYNEKLDSGFYSDFKENIYPVNNFRDYVYIGLVIEKPDWVLNFIKKYSHLLPKKIRENEINLSYSKLEFYRKNYAKSLESVLMVKPGNYLHYLDSAMMRMTNFYELDQIEEAYFEIDKLRHYVRNHKEIPKIHRQYNLNFAKIYNNLLKLKTDYNKKNLISLEDDLVKSVFISKKNWLTEKLGEFKKIKKAV